MNNISAADYERLADYINNGDRARYYTEAYKLTHLQIFLDTAEIATDSDLFGGAAWWVNKKIQTDRPQNYPSSVEEFSIKVALSTLSAFKQNPNGTYNLPASRDVSKAAINAWYAQNLGDVAPPKFYDALFIDGPETGINELWRRLNNFGDSPYLQITAGVLSEGLLIAHNGKTKMQRLDENPTYTEVVEDGFSRVVNEQGVTVGVHKTPINGSDVGNAIDEFEAWTTHKFDAAGKALRDFADDFSQAVKSSVGNAADPFLADVLKAYEMAAQAAQDSLMLLANQYGNAVDFTADKIADAVKFYDDVASWTKNHLDDFSDGTVIKNSVELFDDISKLAQEMYVSGSVRLCSSP